ncbi:MAG TPA: class I SAM-dependent methyltransferase [Verrucomicrobiae bacterium]|nr:class I SAM-dependent methyltransferase [Verrucomicrobiae bacterium]
MKQIRCHCGTATFTLGAMDAQTGAAQAAPRHLPYQIDPSTNRFHYYETLWKQVGLRLLEKHTDVGGKTLLDYGCGRGEALSMYRSAGMLATGTDTDSECVRLAATHGKAVVLNPTDPVGQFGAKSFDVITCFHVLEHVPSPVETLGQLARMARSYVVLAVPNLRFLHWIFHRKFDLGFINEGHLQGWDHWHFRNLAERHCGLELVEWGSDATILPGLSSAAERLFGQQVTSRLETGLFRKFFPYHCLSIIGLFRPKP